MIAVIKCYLECLILYLTLIYDLTAYHSVQSESLSPTEVLGGEAQVRINKFQLVTVDS